ncbi:MAG: hypothetical protein AB2L11_06810 [Syntrophobacteraceae bacterium]
MKTKDEAKEWLAVRQEMLDEFREKGWNNLADYVVHGPNLPVWFDQQEQQSVNSVREPFYKIH